MLKIQTDIYPFLLHVFFSPADYATAVHKCEKLTRTAQLTSESEVDDIVPLRPMDASMDESLERGCLPPFPDAERNVSTVADHGQRPGCSHYRNPSQDISHVILRELLKLKTDVTEIKARIQALQESERRPPAQNSCLPPAETPAFPLRNKDDVAALESRIVEGGYRQTLVEWLSKIGGNTTREAAVRVLRATLTDELASQYSWFGAKGKVQFGTLQLASVLYDAVTATGAITKKDFQVTTMGWMKHARQRVEQKQKKAGTAMEGSRAPSPLEGDR
ncbi:uncharacterized protein LOC120847674 isoform X2 [Ixodes scapularis]|uniref:uncharacterized protein LOC120847674 isoform X2 n=1 Tax=Ixodes scapularis TaxID=6945 RepID=UPI001C3841E9|nr:uncharacterized protein LOC120847674 isoform X2 [Ixodes scapularis]